MRASVLRWLRSSSVGALARRVSLGAVPLVGLWAGAAEAVAPVAAPALKKVSATLDGKKLPLKGAAVYRTGGSALTLEVSTEPLPCSAYEAGGRGIADGEKHFTVQFQPLLQADGSLKWHTMRLELRQQGPERGADLSKLALVDPDAEKPVRFRFDQKFVLPASEFFGLNEAKLELRGEGVALGCGTLKGLQAVPARAQAGLTLTVAGRSFPVLGATLAGDEGDLELNTSPLACDSGQGHDLRIRIAVKPTEEKRHGIYVSGDVLASQHNLSAPSLGAPPAAGAEPGLFVQVVPGAAKGDARTVKVAGAFMLGELPVVLSGEVSALDCAGAR